MDSRQDVFENFEVPDPIRIQKAARLVRAQLSSVRGIALLECGVTKGGLADTLKNEGARCFGVDINPRDVPGVAIQQADLNLGFPKFDAAFDVIFAGEVMEHLFDDEKFVQSARALLKPDGILMLTVPNLVFSMNRLRMLFGMTPLFAYALYHYHIYTRSTLEDLLRRNGFEIADFTSSHVLFSTRRNKRFGRIFEILGDLFPSFGAHLIVCAKKI
ncbi:MAG: class I SAM-dependent methyltransferase [Candidatus Jorgensenbacteria bacterium]|nr:class I SAM-dependent methyltransferase [Candidatus Jorgensenbacteria bacterium]